MIPKSGDRAGLDASGAATAEFSSGNARDTPSRVGSYRKMARECSFHTACLINAHDKPQLMVSASVIVPNAVLTHILSREAWTASEWVLMS
jgi:hypothetical protein